jgi:ABC-type Fe3+-siderophore transport system permease subunit
MAKTKTPIKKKRFLLRTISLGLSALAFLLVFFELVLTMHGGWDDLSYRVIFVAPFVSAVAMVVAVINIAKNRAKSHEIIPALSMVAISTLFFCYVMVYMSTAMLARS